MNYIVIFLVTITMPTIYGMKPEPKEETFVQRSRGWSLGSASAPKRTYSDPNLRQLTTSLNQLQEKPDLLLNNNNTSAPILTFVDVNKIVTGLQEEITVLKKDVTSLKDQNFHYETRLKQTESDYDTTKEKLAIVEKGLIAIEAANKSQSSWYIKPSYLIVGAAFGGVVAALYLNHHYPWILHY